MLGIILISVLVMFIICNADLHPVQWITRLITSRIQIAQRHAWDELEQELRLWSGEQGPELAYMSPSMAMQEINQALTLMACAVYHQPIEPYIPSESEPRYELVMHDEGTVSEDDEVDHGKVGVS